MSFILNCVVLPTQQAGINHILKIAARALPFVFFIYFALIPPIKAAESSPVPGGVWVAVRVQETVEKLMEYHGFLDHKSFWDIISQKSKQGFFRLENAVWISPEGEIIPLSELKAANQFYGYSNDAFFRIENIYRIIPLDASFVDKALKKERKKP